MGMTKKLLTKVSDPDTKLPSGPVMTSPDRLFKSFTREIITRTPQV